MYVLLGESEEVLLGREDIGLSLVYMLLKQRALHHVILCEGFTVFTATLGNLGFAIDFSEG